MYVCACAYSCCIKCKTTSLVQSKMQKACVLISTVHNKLAISEEPIEIHRT